MFNILVINWRDIKNPRAGGVEYHIHEILKRKPENVQIDFISSRFFLSKKKETLEYPIIRLGNELFFDFFFRLKIKKILKRKKYNLIIDDISKIPLGIPKYIKNIPIVGIIHHIHGDSIKKDLPLPVFWYVKAMEVKRLKHYINTPLIAVSHTTKTELLSYYPFSSIKVLHNGVNFDTLKKYKIVKKTNFPTFFYLGRLKRYKQVEHALFAFDLLYQKRRDIFLKIVGKGPDKERLEKICSYLSCHNNVSFLDYMDENEKAKLLFSSWIQIQPSQKEGWGITIIEGNYAYVPSVAYDIPGLKESIKDKKTGLLAKPNDIKDLSLKLEYLLENETIRETYAKNAHEYAKGFDWNKLSKTFYEEVLKYAK